MKQGITRTTMKIMGAGLKEDNPLPYFKELPEDKEIFHDGTLTEQEQEHLGRKCARKVLPYTMQDRYSRKKEELELKTIVLENNKLKAVFLPEYGGRLYSLYSKVLGKELLFRNSVMQPANLGIRNAWFSGGIEWNIGRVGHTFTTCDHVFCARLKDKQGEEFLRIYEFERQTRIFWQIDFHLPEDADYLSACIKINNLDAEDKNMYWWTNTAVPLTKETRVFSGTGEVYYMGPEGYQSGRHQYGHGRLPQIPRISHKDITYPDDIEFGSEYFFQNDEKQESPWEAAVYEDGYFFYDRSTQPLRIRKMFTWGNSQGCKHWCDYLSMPGEGAYLEVQAGLAPSQVHGLTMPGNTSWSFTQIFCGTMVSSDVNYREPDYEKAITVVEEVINDKTDAAFVNRLHENFETYLEQEPEEMLHYGSGFGYLEKLRGDKENADTMPKGLRFETKNLSPAAAIWFSLLEQGRFPQLPVSEKPISFMTDLYWKKYMEQAIDQEGGNWALWYHYGILLYENDQIEEALKAFRQAEESGSNPWALWAMGTVLQRLKRPKEGLDYLRQAYHSGGSELHPAFSEDLLAACNGLARYEEAYEIYLKESAKGLLTDRQRMEGAKCGMETGDMSAAEALFQQEAAGIREGENQFTGLWFEYMARLEAQNTKCAYTRELYEKVAREKLPPKHLDFRMHKDAIY